MSRTDRLFTMIEIFRRSQCAVTAQELSSRFDVSLRSIYRDIALLKNQGVPIEGEAGVGYILRSGYTLPPLMFSVEEMEALILGAKWVSVAADRDLAAASSNALSKIRGVIPQTALSKYQANSLLISSNAKPERCTQRLTSIRKAIREDRKVLMDYTDSKDRSTKRIIWPLAIGFLENSQLLAAWCEKRSSFRCFRIDRIQQWHITAETFPLSHGVLFSRWQEKENLVLDPAEW